MKISSCFAGLAVAALVAAGMWAAEGRQRGGRQAAPSEFDLMVGELKLTDGQKAQIQEKMKAKEAALDAWNTANAEKVKAAEDAAAKAKGGDSTARKSAAEARKELQAGRDQATAEATAAILAVLTDEQKKTWDGLKLYQTLAARYKKVSLTEEQQAKAKAVCVLAAQELKAAEAEDAASGKRGKKGASVADKLKWAVENVILTPEQRQMLPQRGAGKKGAAQTPPANK